LHPATNQKVLLCPTDLDYQDQASLFVKYSVIICYTALVQLLLQYGCCCCCCYSTRTNKSPALLPALSIRLPTLFAYAACLYSPSHSFPAPQPPNRATPLRDFVTKARINQDPAFACVFSAYFFHDSKTFSSLNKMNGGYECQEEKREEKLLSRSNRIISTHPLHC
jgi:hypothetical protein